MAFIPADMICSLWAGISKPTGKYNADNDLALYIIDDVLVHTYEKINMPASYEKVVYILEADYYNVKSRSIAVTAFWGNVIGAHPFFIKYIFSEYTVTKLKRRYPYAEIPNPVFPDAAYHSCRSLYLYRPLCSKQKSCECGKLRRQ